MMGFHKRLGADTLIRKYMSRDIGRWFCEQYITNENNGMKTVIHFGEPSRTQFRDSSILLSSVRISDFDESARTKKLYIETPLLELPRGVTSFNNQPHDHVDPNDPNIKRSFWAPLSKNNRSHLLLSKNIKYLDQLCLDHVYNNCKMYGFNRMFSKTDIHQKSLVQDHSHIPGYENTNGYFQLDLPDSMLSKTVVFCDRKKYTFKQALDNNYFNEYCQIRLILEAAYIYAMRQGYCGYRYIPIQIEVIPSKRKALDEYAFSDSE